MYGCIYLHVHARTHTYRHMHTHTHTHTHTQAFPDALTYTLPIWCAVLNGVLHTHTHTHTHTYTHTKEGEDLLFLPPWVPPSERARVAALLPSFCVKLEEAVRCVCVYVCVYVCV